jgi:hypothetical protein
VTLSISVIVPWRADGGWRDLAWARVVAPFWSRVVEEWPADAELILETPPPSGPGHPGDFDHPGAINRGVARSSGTLLLIADADTLPDASYPRLAARAITVGQQWALPAYYRKLTQEATESMLAYAPTSPGSWLVSDEACEWIGERVSWSGCVAVPRESFLDAGGYDERISWWGADDVAFGLTMTTLYGDAWRVAGVTHLYHPAPPEHNYGHPRHKIQQAIVDRYVAATGDPAAIRRVRAS